MNREFILWNLREASEALGTMIKEIEADASYSEGELFPAMQHLCLGSATIEK